MFYGRRRKIPRAGAGIVWVPAVVDVTSGWGSAGGEGVVWPLESRGKGARGEETHPQLVSERIRGEALDTHTDLEVHCFARVGEDILRRRGVDLLQRCCQSHAGALDRCLFLGPQRTEVVLALQMPSEATFPRSRHVVKQILLEGDGV